MVVREDAESTINFICKNKKNVGHIQEYLLKLEDGNGKEISSVIHILTGVFNFYTQQKTWQCLKDADDMEIDGLAEEEDAELESEENVLKNKQKKKERAEMKVNTWLYNSYKTYIRLLLHCFTHKSPSVRMKALEAMIEIIEAEYTTNLLVKSSVGKTSTKLNFPNAIYIKIVKQLLITDGITRKMIEFVDNLLEYDDLSFYFLRDIHSLLDNQKIAEKYADSADCISRNTYEILMLITSKNADVEKEISLYVDAEDINVNVDDIKESYKREFNAAWMALFHLPRLPMIVQKKILVSLDTKIMPRLTNPKLLIDFLTDSYDAGGVCSLLALNGLFVLVNQYNLDYPDFYTKLYDIIEVNIFHTKYKARFFYHLDLFLTSTHLPAYLVMAFVKKLTRIALFTPGEDIYMLLKFIKNLLIRHPSSRILIHRQNENESKSLPNDPYNYDEDDPYKSNASKSCLWELESLKSHYSKDVLKLLLSFRKEFPLVEDDITEYFEKDFETMIGPRLEVEEIKEERPPPFNFEKRNEIFDFDTEMWCV